MNEDESTSKATLVSIIPQELNEDKPGLIPSFFKIPAAPLGDISILVISDCYHFIYLDHERGSIRVADPALKVANAIVFDYITCQLARTADAEPGLTCFPGALTKDQVKTSRASELAELRVKQRNWFERLVSIADDEWARTGERRGISDLSRMGAKSLGLDKPWIRAVPAEISKVDMKPCPFCMEKIPAQAIVCRVCRGVIDTKKFKEMQAIQA